MTKREIISKYHNMWYVLTGIAFWCTIGFWIAWSAWVLAIGLPIMGVTIRLIVLSDGYQNTDYKAWKEEFALTHTFLYKWKNPDPDCIDINYWRNNDTFKIVKQVAGQNKLIP